MTMAKLPVKRYRLPASGEGAAVATSLGNLESPRNWTVAALFECTPEIFRIARQEVVHEEDDEIPNLYETIDRYDGAIIASMPLVASGLILRMSGNAGQVSIEDPFDDSIVAKWEQNEIPFFSALMLAFPAGGHLVGVRGVDEETYVLLDHDEAMALTYVLRSTDEFLSAHGASWTMYDGTVELG
jgi:hypothetical protein